MAAKAVSFINLKGGVGKSTLSMTVSEYLATLKVSMTECIPQFNSLRHYLSHTTL